MSSSAKKKKATINDIARLAGVSKKTVSRVINNQQNVGAETLRRVQDIMQEYNYVPDPRARGLASNRSFQLALVYDNPNAAFITEAMYGILDRCRPAGYELVVHPCDSTSSSFEDELLSFVERSRIDGCILTPPISESKTLAKRLTDQGCNFVRMLPTDVNDATHTIVSDHQQAIADIAEHLVSLGHSRIGFIHGPKGYQSAKIRYQCFVEALADQGVDLPARRIAYGNYTFESGVDCADWFLRSNDPPTAIFASNDEMAIGAVVAANRNGLSIPADLTIVGFDDNPHASQIWPPLTTANLQVRRLAQLAAEKLLAQCRNDLESAASIQTGIDTMFVRRQSTAPPRD